MIIQNGVEIASTIKLISPEEYEQLSDTEKKNGTMYLITGCKEINRELSFLKKIIGDFEGLKKNLPDDFPEEKKTILGIILHLIKSLNDTCWWKEKREVLVDIDAPIPSDLLNGKGETVLMRQLRRPYNSITLPYFNEPVGDYTNIFIELKKILSKTNLTEKYLKFVKTTGRSTISGALSDLLVRLNACTISYNIDSDNRPIVIIKKKDKVLLRAKYHIL